MTHAFKLLDVPTNDDHNMKEKQACPPYSSSNIDVVNADPALQVYMGLSVNNNHHGVADEQYRDEIE